MMLEIKNNKTGIPLAQYRSIYREMQAEAMAACCDLPFDGEYFHLRLLNRPVKMSFPEGKAAFTDSGETLSEVSTILLLRYLTEGAKVRSSEKFIAYSEIPWGPTYIRQFTGRCINRLAFSYGNDLELFARCCESIGGVRAVGAISADAAYDIPFLENLTVRLLLWEQDEEFPPSAQILFSDNFPQAFTAEDTAYVGDTLIDALKSKTIS